MEGGESGMEVLLRSLRVQGYLPEGSGFSTGRADRTTLPLLSQNGMRVVAKFYPDGGGDRTYAQMQELWNSTFGEPRRPPGLPRPLDYLPEMGALLMERIHGSLCIERSQLDDETVEEIVRVVVALHECEVRPVETRDAVRVFRAVRRKAAQIVHEIPPLGDAVWAVIDALKRELPSEKLVPTHGDCSPRNILIAPSRIVLIDWDRFQLADPALDIAHLGAWYWVWGLRQGRRPDWSVLERVVSVYQSLRPHAAVVTRLRFYLVVRLLRTAQRILEVWPEEAHLVPELVAEAVRQVEREGSLN